MQSWAGDDTSAKYASAHVAGSQSEPDFQFQFLNKLRRIAIPGGADRRSPVRPFDPQSKAIAPSQPKPREPQEPCPFADEARWAGRLRKNETTLDTPSSRPDDDRLDNDAGRLAQLARARGRHPRGQWFESIIAHYCSLKNSAAHYGGTPIISIGIDRDT